MTRWISIINQNCRTASRLGCESLDRPLSRLEQTGLHIHLMGCRSCRRFRKQITQIDKIVEHIASQQETEVRLPAESRQRITHALRR